MGIVTTGNGVLATSDRDRILQAMADCCAEGGYAKTTLEAVLERAGADLESFESLFADKEACALAALNKMVSETLARISMTGSPGEDAVGRTRFEGKAILELMAARSSFAKLGLIDSRQCGTDRMHDSYESAARVLALMTERMVGAADPPAAPARAALGGAEAVIRRELAAGRAAALPQLLPDFVYALLVPFVGQGEALRQAKRAARAPAEEG